MIWVHHILVKRAYTTAKLFLVSSIHWSPQEFLGSFCYWTLIRSTNSVWVTLAPLKTAYIHLIQKWRPIYYSFLCI